MPSVNDETSAASTTTPTDSSSMIAEVLSPKKRHLSSPAKLPLSTNSPKKAKGMSPVGEKVSERMEVMEVETAVGEVDKVGAEVDKVKALSLKEEGEAPKLFFAKMSEKAHPPTRGSQLAAGYDLKSAYKYTVPARGSCLVKTDIQIKLPSGYYGRVAPRSGLALKNKIDVGAGVIDEDYRGNVGVILFNHGDSDFEVNEGDRVAQLICEKICYPDLVELKTLDETERGEGGFGSTGVGSDQKSA